MKLKNNLILILYIFTIYLVQFDNTPLIETLIVLLWIWEAWIFLVKAGNSLPVLNVIILACMVQWLIAPIIIYQFYINEILLFPMAVDEDSYFKLAVPLALVFVLALKSFKAETFDFKTVFSKIKMSKELNKRLGFTFMGLGIIASLVGPYFPSSLAFVAYLLNNLLYVAVIYLFYSSYSFKWYLIGVIFLVLVYNVIRTTMFGDTLAWGFFMLLFISLNYNFSIKAKLFGFVISILLISVVQIIKADFRGTLSQDYGLDRSAEFKRAIQYNVEIADFRSKIFYLPSVERINQGAIISYIFKQVPAVEPYAGGETVENAFISTLIPRFIYEDKQTSGGKKNFSRFTGKPLVGATSMDLSILGEVYANYGLSMMALIVIYLIGFLHRYIFNVVLKLSRDAPHLLFIIPIIFLQLIKAESDIFTNLNFLVKGLIFAVIIRHLFLIRENSSVNEGSSRALPAS